MVRSLSLSSHETDVEQGRAYRWDLDKNTMACISSSDPRVTIVGVLSARKRRY